MSGCDHKELLVADYAETATSTAPGHAATSGEYAKIDAVAWRKKLRAAFCIVTRRRFRIV